MADTATTIDTYLAAYGETDPARRRAGIEASWDANGHLADPPMDAAGHDALDAMFAAVQAQFPGHLFRRTSGIDEHHDTARYSWDLIAPDGTASVAGTDIARLNQTGKLTSVTGFFGPLPELDS